MAQTQIKKKQVLNEYKFRAYRNAAANTGNAEFAVVAFDTEQYDTGGNLSSGVFTAPVTGYYQFNWGVTMVADGSSRLMISGLFINGTEYSRGGRINAAANEVFVSTGGDTVYMTAGQTADIRAYGAVALALGVSVIQSTYFSGRYIGS